MSLVKWGSERQAKEQPEVFNMTKSSAQTVGEYVAELPSERQDAIVAVRKVILDNLPGGYKETMMFGMIGYGVPLETYPVTYNRQPLMYAALASQKNYMSLYLMNVYGDKETEQWFAERYRASGKKMDMGKSCVRFKNLEDLPLDLIGQAIARTTVAQFVERYEASRRNPRKQVASSHGRTKGL